MKRPVDRYIDSLLRRRRPRPFAPSEDDLALTRTAIALAAAGPDAAGPAPEFVEELRRKIGAQHAAAEAASANTALAAIPEPSRAVPARRRFLQATAVTAGAAAVGATADHLITRRPTGSAPAAESELTPVVGTWQTVATDADLPEGGVLSFNLSSVFGFVQRTSGRVQAVSGICTHQGCRLDLKTPSDELVCPCHGATFSLSGQPLSYPNSKYTVPPLPRLAVRVKEGSIQVYAPPPNPTADPTANSASWSGGTAST